MYYIFKFILELGKYYLLLDQNNTVTETYFFKCIIKFWHLH